MFQVLALASMFYHKFRSDSKMEIQNSVSNSIYLYSMTDDIISWEHSVQMGLSPMVLGTLSGKRKAKRCTGSSYYGDPFIFPSYFIVSLLGRLF